MNNNLLTVLITTYNRSDYLDTQLHMLNEFQNKGLDFCIIVSDDCSTDNTKEVGEKWNSLLSNYLYKRLPFNQGMDANFISAYSECRTKYCWLLGDHRYISFNDMKMVLNTLNENKYDALVLNCPPYLVDKNVVYTDVNTLLLELGHNITNNASCIIPSSFFYKWAYSRYIGTTFLHMGIFVENLCQMDSFSVLYMSNVKVKHIELDDNFVNTGWYHHPFLNFGRFWYTFVMSLPNKIELNNKKAILLNHNRKLGLFSLRRVIDGRKIYGKQFVDSYKENREFINFVVDRPRWLYDILILYLPYRLFCVVNYIMKFL